MDGFVTDMSSETTVFPFGRNSFATQPFPQPTSRIEFTSFGIF